MNAEEEKNMDKKKANKPTNQNCVHGSKNIQMVAMEIPVVIYCGFFVLLKCDPFEETPRKAEGYACQDKVRRLSKWDSIFKANYSLQQTFDGHDQHACCMMSKTIFSSKDSIEMAVSLSFLNYVLMFFSQM